MSETPPQPHVPVPGSERAPLPGARPVRPVDPNERIEVSVYLRAPQRGTTPPPGTRMTREEYAATYGAERQTLERIEAFAQQHGLTVVESDPVRRRVVLAGPVSAMRIAFGVELHHYEHPGGSYRGRTGPVLLPADLVPLVEAVVGLDDRPQTRTHFRPAQGPTTQSYTPLQIASLYNFPTQGNGQGQCIALIELGGGFRTSDVHTYFEQLGLPVPMVTSVSVDGGANDPTNPQGADGEVALDIEIAGGIAPGAQIAVYFAPNTDRGFLDAITQATHDTQHNPSIISISWGGPESSWTAQAMQAMDQAFQAAGVLGITVCCAAGDNGSSDGVNDGLAHVDFPASSPHALACGGTRLDSANGIVLNEIVWHEPAGGATGGGISDVFDLPTWQAGANVPPSINPNGRVGRGVPDVAANADPQTGYQVLVDGQSMVIGGTSAVAPLWAGLLALINQQLGRSAGYLNPALYQQLVGGNAFRDVIVGNNGGYKAGSGWDACTGLGAADGTQLLAGLRASGR